MPDIKKQDSGIHRTWIYFCQLQIHVFSHPVRMFPVPKTFILSPLAQNIIYRGKFTGTKWRAPCKKKKKEKKRKSRWWQQNIKLSLGSFLSMKPCEIYRAHTFEAGLASTVLPTGCILASRELKTEWKKKCHTYKAFIICFA